MKRKGYSSSYLGNLPISSGTANAEPRPPNHARHLFYKRRQQQQHTPEEEDFERRSLVVKTVDLPKGECYEGQVNQLGLFEGHGRYLYHSGDIYEGEWSEGLPSGTGSYIYAYGRTEKTVHSKGTLVKSSPMVQSLTVLCIEFIGKNPKHFPTLQRLPAELKDRILSFMEHHHGLSPVNAVVATGYDALFSFMLENGLDQAEVDRVNLQDVKGGLPIVNAIQHNQIAMLKKLLQHFTFAEESKIKAIRTAVKRNSKEALQVLIDYYGNQLIQAADERRSLVSKCHSPEIVKILVSAGANVDGVSWNSIQLRPPLHGAIKANDIPLVKALLENGANVQLLDVETGLSALHLGLNSSTNSDLFRIFDDYRNKNNLDWFCGYNTTNPDIKYKDIPPPASAQLKNSLTFPSTPIVLSHTEPNSSQPPATEQTPLSPSTQSSAFNEAGNPFLTSSPAALLSASRDRFSSAGKITTPQASGDSPSKLVAHDPGNAFDQKNVSSAQSASAPSSVGNASPQTSSAFPSRGPSFNSTLFVPPSSPFFKSLSTNPSPFNPALSSDNILTSSSSSTTSSMSSLASLAPSPSSEAREADSQGDLIVPAFPLPSMGSQQDPVWEEEVQVSLRKSLHEFSKLRASGHAGPGKKPAKGGKNANGFFANMKKYPGSSMDLFSAPDPAPDADATPVSPMSAKEARRSLQKSEGLFVYTPEDPENDLNNSPLLQPNSSETPNLKTSWSRSQPPIASPHSLKVNAEVQPPMNKLEDTHNEHHRHHHHHGEHVHFKTDEPAKPEDTKTEKTATNTEGVKTENTQTENKTEKTNSADNKDAAATGKSS